MKHGGSSLAANPPEAAYALPVMRALAWAMATGASLLMGSCASPAPRPASHGSVTIEQIADGIKQHIAAQTQATGGYYPLPYAGQQLKLTLVRVHMEYLSDLGGGVHFACVDLADVAGDVYDVDFFLAGDPGSMTVTETTVHKRNGQPFYAWEQAPDGTWHRVPIDQASSRLLGVILDRDAFDFRYHVTLPGMTETARMWVPLPISDAFQTVALTSLAAPGTHRILEDREYGNQVLFFELAPTDSAKQVDILFRVHRREKAVYAESLADPKQFLKPDRLVPATDEFRGIAEKVVKGKQGDLERARALYDHVIDRMRYMKYGTGWGKGDAVYACNGRTGNCTDFHAYFIALSRSVGIPARFAIGASIPSERNEGGIDGYHCWAEFYADGRWWPIDISEANKYTALSTYYFGHNPANRFEFSRGRDLVVDPGPASGPINFLAYPVLEVGGKPAKVDVTFSFNRSASL